MRPRVAAAAWALAAVLPSLALASYPTPEEVRAELGAVCERLRRDSPYFGDGVVDWLRESLAGAAAGSEGRALLHGKLGTELLRLGRLEEAIVELEEGLRQAEAARLDPRHDLVRRLRLTLGVTHLQLGEDRNCVAHHGGRSCLLPIAPEAVHAIPGPARTAGDHFLRLLAAIPDDPEARWLLNLARMTTGDWPQGVPEAQRLPDGALESAVPFPAWRNRAPELGIDAIDLAGGAAVEDFDGDGLLDLVSSSWDPCEPMKAFRNDGRGGFEDVTAAWGLDSQLGGLNLVHADFDDDGRPDLLVLRGAWLGAEGRIRNSLLRNDLGGPAGRFVDVTAAAGLAYPAYPTQTAAWADFDGDGDLDLYVGNEGSLGTTDPVAFLGEAGDAYPSQLFRNNGNGTFTDVARRAGVQNRRFTKGVAWGDYDGDGDPDLYVSTFGDNRLYRNNGDGIFVDVAPELGVLRPRGSFPTWFFDYDNDGDLDLFVAAFSIRAPALFATYFGAAPPPGHHPVLYRNDGGRFTDATAEMELDVPSLPMGANYGDVDTDGWPDLYLGTGLPEFTSLMPNLMYRNREGRRFDDVTFAGGFGHLQKGHGVAFGDLDNDGDQDLFEQMGGAFPYDTYGNALYENPGEPAAWIVLRLEGRQANRAGIGARIAVEISEGGTSRQVHAVVGTGGSFGSNSLQQEIGLGRAEAIRSVTLLWPGSGTRQVFEDVELNRFYRAVEGEPELVPVELPRLRIGGGPSRR